MSKSSIVEGGNKKRAVIEKNILQELDCVFIISLLGTHQDSSHIYFLTDFIQGGNLMSYMINKDVLSHSECVFFSANIVSALIHIHKKGFVHRDLKPENCLIDKLGYLKLCDFGMAKRLPCIVQLPNGGTEAATLAFTMCGTPEFMAPEFVLSTGYDKGVDIWALGCILVEMYIGRSPFEFKGDLKKTFRKVCLIGMGRNKYSRPDVLKKEGMHAAGKFVEGLLSSHQNRLGKSDSTALRAHEYYESIDFDLMNRKQISAPYIPNISHASDVSNFTDDGNRSEDTVEAYTGDDAWCQDF
jgi:serine/threonine protein kinase